jgi:A/G-specific adenine glycosylase
LARGTQLQRPLRAPRKAVPHRAVSAAVLRRRGRVLICRRPEDKLLGGMWEFPGGKQEAGETLIECLRRELREELDIDVVVGAEIGVFDHAYTHFSVRVHAFECRLSAGKPRPLEHSRIEWAAPSELERYPMGKVDRQIANRLRGVTPRPPAESSPASRRKAR